MDMADIVGIDFSPLTSAELAELTQSVVSAGRINYALAQTAAEHGYEWSHRMGIGDEMSQVYSALTATAERQRS